MIFEVKPTVVGHRGFGAGEAGGYRENSVESFLAAAETGVSWVELDVRRSSDGELVLWHDPVTPGGQVILSRTANQLAAAGVVRLDDVLSALPSNVGVNLDVKTVIEDATDPEPQRTHAIVAAALGRHQGSRRFFASSFDPGLPMYLKDRKSLIGDVALGLITGTDFPADHGIPAAAHFGLDAVCLHTGTLQLHRDRLLPADLGVNRIIETARRAGLEVMVWSPSPAESVRLAQAGVDAVCVNDIPGAGGAGRSSLRKRVPRPADWSRCNNAGWGHEAHEGDRLARLARF